MLPDRCSVGQNGRRCVNPPEFVVSVESNDGEYMVGVACGRHKNVVSDRLAVLQKKGSIPSGKIIFAELNAVGTDCIKANADDLIQL